MNIGSLIFALPKAIREQYAILLATRKATPLASRLYIYSIVFDPFLFFVMLDRLTAGMSITLSRVFQILFYALLFIKFVPIRKISAVRVMNRYWVLFLLFLGYVVAIYCAGLLFGFNFIATNKLTESDAATAFAAALAAPEVRPIVELSTLFLTVFHYFWFGPRMVRTRESYQLLCSSLLLLCYVSLVLGFLNFLAALLFGQNLMPRHLVEYLYSAPSFSGVRFQGLAGEPRDAFGQLVLFLAVFYFLAKVGVVRLSEQTRQSVVLVSLIALALTISASGMVALGIFIVMYVAHDLWVNFSFKRVSVAFSAVSVSVIFMWLGYSYIERFELYFDTFYDVFELIEAGGELPPLVLTQLNNFYPLIVWWKSCVSSDFAACFLGGGLGTSFALNSHLYAEGLNNPHSYISRLIPELGILGMGMFVAPLLVPMFRYLDRSSRYILTLDSKVVRIIKISLLALFAAVLAHKSNNLYFGLLIIALGLNLGSRIEFGEIKSMASGCLPHVRA